MQDYKSLLACTVLHKNTHSNKPPYYFIMKALYITIYVYKTIYISVYINIYDIPDGPSNDKDSEEKKKEASSSSQNSPEAREERYFI